METQALSFDWDSLDDDLGFFLLEKAEAIKARMKRSAEDVIAIGQDLLAVKERLPHGQFLGWLQSEFEMSQPTAYNFMQVASKFGDGKFINFINLSASVLYELAKPNTPDDVIEQVTSGQIPASLPAIREAKATPRQPEALAPTPILALPVVPPRQVPALPAPVYDAEIAGERVALRQMDREIEAEVNEEMGWRFHEFMHKWMDYRFEDQDVMNAIQSSFKEEVDDWEAMCDEAIAQMTRIKQIIQQSRQIRVVKGDKLHA